jgi:hypothetical protein
VASHNACCGCGEGRYIPRTDAQAAFNHTTRVHAMTLRLLWDEHPPLGPKIHGSVKVGVAGNSSKGARSGMEITDLNVWFKDV